MIIHVGDVGDPSILEALKQIAPTIAIRGNVDEKRWRLAATASSTSILGALALDVSACP